MPVLSRITLYPIKSLDGVDVHRARLTAGGLAVPLGGGRLAGPARGGEGPAGSPETWLHDRELALVDERGAYINGKSAPGIFGVRAHYDLERGAVHLRAAGQDAGEFSVRADAAPENWTALQAWFGRVLGRTVYVTRNPHGTQLDTPEAGALSLVGAESLAAVAEWFSLSVDETHRRFRGNLGLSGAPPFWEDALFGYPGTEVAFRLGDVPLCGTGPVPRCPVPSRNPDSGEILSAFARTFTTTRKRFLPAGSLLMEYGHAYFLAVHLRVPPQSRGRELAVGAPLEIPSTLAEASRPE